MCTKILPLLVRKVDSPLLVRKVNSVEVRDLILRNWCGLYSLSYMINN